MNALEKLLLAPVALSLAFVAACSSTPALPEGTNYGEEMHPGEIVSFSIVDATPSDYFERTVLVEATVTAVCKKKGCWMQVEDEGRTALVRWETGCGGKYVFPMEAVGKRVIVQGSFYPKTLSPDDAEHMREEAGGDVELELDGYEFNASAVRIKS